MSVSSKNGKLTGREKGAFAYGADEHIALLSLIQLVPSSFNASESSPEWREAHKKMVDVYDAMNVQPRQSTTLHSHFVELYSALKLGIRCLSVKSDSPKCPDEIKDDDDSVDIYVEALLQLLLSDSKKFQPRKWWSLSVVRMLLYCHLHHLKAFGNSKQDASWLEKQKVVTKSKFELDQKNQEDEIARKRAIEENERMEAAKNRKAMAEASDRLVSCFEAMAQRDSQ